MDWQVCGEASNGYDAVTQAAQLVPDVVVIDLAMPQMNGLQTAREIFTRSPTLPMLLLTVQEVSTELAREATRAGFQGAVSKNTGAEVILGIETLLRKEKFFRYSPFDMSAD